MNHLDRRIDIFALRKNILHFDRIFNKDFSAMSTQPGEEFCMGPFSGPMAFDSIRNLSRCLLQGYFDEVMFFDPLDPRVTEAGFKIFCERSNLDPEKLKSVRSILALGMWWNKSYELEEELVSDEDQETDSIEEIVEEEFTLTPEEVADKFERHFMRAANAYKRARLLTKLLNSDIEFCLTDKGENYRLQIRGGFITGASSLETNNQNKDWKSLDIDTYDRMSVLLMELDKIRSQEGFVQISQCCY